MKLFDRVLLSKNLYNDTLILYFDFGTISHFSLLGISIATTFCPTHHTYLLSLFDYQTGGLCSGLFLYASFPPCV
jgi:hypothetical protein